MFKSIRAIFKITLMVIFALMIHREAHGSIPPHPRVQQMIKEGKIPLPYHIAKKEEALQRGINSLPVIFSKQSHRLLDGMQSSTFRALAILVTFTDKPFQVSAVFFDSLLYGVNGHTLRNYYAEVSRGSLDVVTVNFPSSMGWMTAPRTYASYANGQNGFGAYPNNAQKLTEDAIAAVNSVVDFSQYDNDHDGYVDGLFIIHSGPGAEYTGNKNDIWSHQWATRTPQLVDGVYAYVYSMEPEYWTNPGDMTCGVYAHEAGHAIFGLPDLYDYDYDSQGLGRWSLMAGGSWNGSSGDSPAHPDAYCLSKMGFANMMNVTMDASGVIIPAVKDSGKIFRLWKDGAVGSEYFLVENRQRVGYDAYLPGSGLCIYHIDETQSGNNHQWYPGYTSNGHYKVALEQADGSWNLEHNQNGGDARDPYPGSAYNRAFDNSSTPNSQSYDGQQSYVGITNISNSGTNMTANFYVQATPPDIELVPSSFAVTVSAGDTARKNMTIRNTGTGNLNFQMSSMPSWLVSQTINGTVPTGSSQEVKLIFNSPNMTPGIYNGSVTITNNAPNKNPLIIPVSLIVLDQPNIVVGQDTIDFGNMFVAKTHAETLVVHNKGSMELLCNSITTNNPVFSSNVSTLSVSPNSQRAIIVSFVPSSLGNFTGNLIIQNNDPDDSIHTVFLKGQGVSPPTIFIPQDTVAVSLHRGDSALTSFTISNVGLGDLMYNLSVQPDTVNVGDTSTAMAGKLALRGNIWRVKEISILYEIKCFLDIHRTTQLEYSIYESDNKSGPYQLIMSQDVPNSGTGKSFYSSGQMEVIMNPWKYYFVALTSLDTVTYYSQVQTLPFKTSSEEISANGLYNSFPYPIMINPTLDTSSVIYQSLALSQKFVSTIFPATGNISPSGSSDINVRVLANLRLGIHRVTLCVNSNDPLAPRILVPLQLTVLPQNISVQAGWNLLSLPVRVANNQKNILFPTSETDIFSYEYSYQRQDTLENGIGYWVKFPSQQFVEMTGNEILCDTLNLNQGWNIIGTVTYPTPAVNAFPVSPLTLQSSFIGYSSDIGYFDADTLKPGEGYWTRASANGELILNSAMYSNTTTFLSSTKNSVSYLSQSRNAEGGQKDRMCSLLFTDKRGRKRSLYFTAEPNGIDVQSFELPPSPPADMFDARFASQRSLEVVNNQKRIYPIIITGTEAPITLSWDNQEDISGANLNVDGYIISLHGKGTIHLAKESIISLTLNGADEIPKDYTLEQNYPNPFNPQTTLRYQLATPSHVTLVIYNQLGQEIACLVDETLDAGYYEYVWDASHTSSGIYYLRMSVVDQNGKQSYQAIQKLVVMK